jgi:hypothetical protein
MSAVFCVESYLPGAKCLALLAHHFSLKTRTLTPHEITTKYGKHHLQGMVAILVFS